MQETTLRTDTEARRQLNLGSSRRWKIVNNASKNTVGQPPGYTLLAGENAVPFAAPDLVVHVSPFGTRVHVDFHRVELQWPAFARLGRRVRWLLRQRDEPLVLLTIEHLFTIEGQGKGIDTF